MLAPHKGGVACALQGQGSSSRQKPRDGYGSNRRRGKLKCHGNGYAAGGGGGGTASNGDRDVSKDKCHNCEKLGHWARDYRKPRRNEQANLTHVDDNEPTLRMV